MPHLLHLSNFIINMDEILYIEKYSNVYYVYLINPPKNISYFRILNIKDREKLDNFKYE